MGDRLREALVRWENEETVTVEELFELVAAARRVLDARHPDYEAAAQAVRDFAGPTGMDDPAREFAITIVDAAVGGGLIVEDE